MSPTSVPAPMAARGRPRWQLAAIAGASFLLSIVVALTSNAKLWYLDEEIYLGHGVRILESGRIGWHVDCWNPPLSFFVHGSLLLLHPATPRLDGPVVQDPDLPPTQETVPGKKNPVLYDSSTHEIRMALERGGWSFDRYVFWARLPLAVAGAGFLVIAWRLLASLGVDPLPGTALLGLSHLFVMEQVRVQADALVAGIALLAAWRAIELARQPTMARGLLLGVAFGLGLATKLSILPLIPAIVLALVPWTLFAAEPGQRSVATVLRNARAAMVPLALGACACFLTLWTIYGFQVGGLADRYATQRPLAPEPPNFVRNHPKLASLPVPMPSFFITFAVSRDTAREGTHIKIDEKMQVPATRKLEHYSARLLAHVGLALLPLTLLAAAGLARDERWRWLLAGVALIALAYFASMWLQNLELLSRRAIVLTVLAAIVAGLAWRDGATAAERKLRAPLLAVHVVLCLVQVTLYAFVREASYSMPLDGILLLH